MCIRYGFATNGDVINVFYAPPQKFCAVPGKVRGRAQATFLSDTKTKNVRLLDVDDVETSGRCALKKNIKSGREITQKQESELDNCAPIASFTNTASRTDTLPERVRAPY